MAFFDAHINFGYSTVATAPSPASSGTSLVVQAGDGAGFPATPFNAVVWPTGVQPTKANAEIVRVTGLTGDTFTITRIQEATSARTIIVGDQIANVASKKVFTDIEAMLNGVSVLTDAATVTLDASIPAVLFTLAAGGDRTLAAPTNPTVGRKFVVRHFASGGARTLTLTTSAGGFHFGSDLIGLSQTASGKEDYFETAWNERTSLWDVRGYVKGF